MNCYHCNKEISGLEEPIILITEEGEKVVVHEPCLCFIEVDNNGVIQK